MPPPSAPHHDEHKGADDEFEPFSARKYDFPEPDISLDDIDLVVKDADEDDGTFSLLGTGVDDPGEVVEVVEEHVQDTRDDAEDLMTKQAERPMQTEKEVRLERRWEMMRNISAEPDEDSIRLAFADMLDDHADEGDEPELFRVWAERIRLQCSLTVDPTNKRSQKRDEVLRQNYGHRLMEYFENLFTPKYTLKFSTLKKGFPSEMYAPFSPFLDKQGSIELWKQGLTFFPIETLEISYANTLTEDELQDLLKTPGFRNVRQLLGSSLADVQMKHIATQSQLTTLNLGASRYLSAACLRDIGKLTNLKILNIDGIYAHDMDAMVEALAPLSNLEHLRVSQNMLTPLLGALGQHPDWLPNLKSIDNEGRWNSVLTERTEQRHLASEPTQEGEA